MTNRKAARIFMALLVALLPAFALGCKRQKQPAIPPPPPVVKQEFTGPQEGFPPQVRGRTNVSAVAAQDSGVLTDARAVQTRDAALLDQRVRQALGDRFTYITIDEIEPEKGQAIDRNRPLVTRVTFFSYANNAAVYVRMNGQTVESVTKKDGFQPPEGREEIAAAIALASRDSNLRGKLEGLTGRGILTYTPDGRPESGHRVLRITFRRGDEDVPRYFAMVDLTDQKVLSSGAVAGENKEQTQ